MQRSNAVCLIVIGLIAQLAGELSAVQADTADEVLEYLERLANSCSAIESEFMATGPLVVSAPRIREEWPDAAPKDMEGLAGSKSRRFRWYHVDGLTRIERHYDDPETEVVAWLWNGRKWYTQIHNPESKTENQLLIDPYCNKDVDLVGSLDVWNGGVDFRAGISSGKLADTLRTAEVIRSERTSDSMSSRFRLSSGGDRWEVEVVCRATDDGRYDLAEVIVDGFDMPEAKHASRSQFTIDKWAEFDGVRLPSQAHIWRAIFDVPLLIERGLDPIANYTVLERVSASVVDRDTVDPMTFEPTAAPFGTWVGDSTLRITYTIGKAAILVDGRYKKLAKPIEAMITDNLPDILQANGGGR